MAGKALRRPCKVMPPHPQTDALVIGGGPAGAALAAHLARRGRSVEVLEQSPTAHHKVCGEFLSREAITYLEELGLDLRAQGAVAIHAVRLASRSVIAECELPFPALSLTRRTLDEALLAIAARAGATVLRGRRVISLQSFASGWAASLADGQICRGSAAFLATGKHDLAGHRRPRAKQNDLIAFKMYFRLAPEQERALRGCVELIVFRGGYAGLQLAEGGQANLCLVVQRKTFKSCRNCWPFLLEHLLSASNHLAQQLEGAQPLLPKPLALSSIPYGLLVSPPQSGLWRLGDQAAVIPSFSGDGISIALHSARAAAEICSNGGTAAQLTKRLNVELKSSIHLASAVSRLLVAAPGLAQLARLWPPLLRLLAVRTRIPSRALLMELHSPL
jgi:menaquinone-9 beta-reductase